MTILIVPVIFSVVAAVLAWFAANFLGKPVLAVREKRSEAIKTAEQYCAVGPDSSDELRTTALKSLNELGSALRACSREGSIATRLYCRLMKYDLELAACSLFGLAKCVLEKNISENQRKNTVNGLYVSLGATSHMTQTEIETSKRHIAEAGGKPTLL
jgi:hypothetical protein